LFNKSHITIPILAIFPKILPQGIHELPEFLGGCGVNGTAVADFFPAILVAENYFKVCGWHGFLEDFSRQAPQTHECVPLTDGYGTFQKYNAGRLSHEL
jgi:hypothetical protein